MVAGFGESGSALIARQVSPIKARQKAEPKPIDTNTITNVDLLVRRAAKFDRDVTLPLNASLRDKLRAAHQALQQEHTRVVALYAYSMALQDQIRELTSAVPKSPSKLASSPPRLGKFQKSDIQLSALRAQHSAFLHQEAEISLKRKNAEITERNLELQRQNCALKNEVARLKAQLSRFA